MHPFKGSGQQGKGQKETLGLWLEGEGFGLSIGE
jgi:hypothetical protein